ncbi:PrgI family protein [Ruminococcus sp. XPD3002]|uniref:PrgI family protein n=1 Tax=Ruminococcus sp. XPD3002 TaxID=1452269 RepID=UPI00094D90FC
MLEVKIPIEIHDYKSKIIAGLSVRQIAAIGGALLTALPIGVIGHGRISMDILPWFIIAITIPWVLWGFFTFQGLKFEDYFHSWISFNLLPQKRVYEDTDESLFQGLHEELLAEKIIKQRIDNGEEINQEG